MAYLNPKMLYCNWRKTPTTLKTLVSTNSGHKIAYKTSTNMYNATIEEENETDDSFSAKRKIIFLNVNISTYAFKI